MTSKEKKYRKLASKILDIIGKEKHYNTYSPDEPLRFYVDRRSKYNCYWFILSRIQTPRGYYKIRLIDKEFWYGQKHTKVENIRDFKKMSKFFDLLFDAEDISSSIISLWDCISYDEEQAFNKRKRKALKDLK